MTRKEHVKFAAMISNLKRLTQYREPIAFETLEIVQVEMDKIFAADNPAYDSDGFFAACHPNAVPELKSDTEYQSEAVAYVTRHTKYDSSELAGNAFYVEYQGAVIYANGPSALTTKLSDYMKKVDMDKQGKLELAS